MDSGPASTSGSAGSAVSFVRATASDRLLRHATIAHAPISAHEHPVPAGPEPALVPQRQQRFHQRGVSDQRDEAADVARRIEKVRVASGWMVRPRKPVLKNRCARSEHEERQANRTREENQQPGDRSTFGRRDRLALDHKRKHGERQHEERDVQRHLRPGADPGGDAVRVCVSRQQRDLEEDHAGIPDHRRAAKQRQHHLGDHRLNEEQQERADKQRRREQRDHRRSGAHAREIACVLELQRPARRERGEIGRLHEGRSEGRRSQPAARLECKHYSAKTGGFGEIGGRQRDRRRRNCDSNYKSGPATSGFALPPTLRPGTSLPRCRLFVIRRPARMTTRRAEAQNTRENERSHLC